MSDDVSLGSTCGTCGEVELAPEQVWLVIATVAASSHYSFSCPRCSRLVSHHADADVISVLGRLVPVEELEVPAEALEVRSGGALTIDDLLDLMLGLDLDAAPLDTSKAPSGAAG